MEALKALKEKTRHRHEQRVNALKCAAWTRLLTAIGTEVLNEIGAGAVEIKVQDGEVWAQIDVDGHRRIDASFDQQGQPVNGQAHFSCRFEVWAEAGGILYRGDDFGEALLKAELPAA